MPDLRAIFFDIDDTLCATSEFAHRARRNAVRAMIRTGLRAPEEVVWGELEEVIAEFSSNYSQHFDKMLLRLRPEALEHANRALVVAAGVAAYHDTKFRELKPAPGVVELFRDLRAASMRLGIVTHGLTVKQAEKLVRLGLVPYLDPEAIFISDQVGINKPNPKLYALAVRAVGLEPRQTMYVGDNPANDVGPPRSIGMITVWARGLSRQALDEDSREVDPDHAPLAARRRTEDPQGGEPHASPHHVIEGFEDLRVLLRERYLVALP